MSNWNKLSLLVLLLVLLKVYLYFIRILLSRQKITNLYNKISNGLVSVKDLGAVSEDYFAQWCMELLKKLNFKNIQLLSTDQEKNVQVLAFKKYKKVYIRWLILDSKAIDSEDKSEIICKEEIQRFVGTMEHDNIKFGYFITNSYFSKDGREYAASLPGDIIDLKLINGSELTRIHRQFQKFAYRVNLNLEV